MPTLTSKQTVQKAKVLRNEALSNRARDNFANITVETEGYLSGDAQIPEGFSRSDYRGQGYRIVNFEPDLTDRITAMIAGRSQLRATAVDGSPDIIDRMVIALMNEWKDSVHFPGVLFEWTHEGVAYNIGAARAYHDPTKLQRRGGFIGIEIPHPLSIWISPYARDPYHPLLGSDYVGYETLMTRDQLIARYGEKKRQIKQLPAYNSDAVQGDEFDPIYHLTQPFRGGSESTQKGADVWTPGSAHEQTAEKEERRGSDRIRVTNVLYEAYEEVNAEGVIDAIATWRTFTIAGDLGIEAVGKAVELEPDDVVPYNRPNIVLFLYRRSLSSVYGSGGAPAAIHDLQDAFNMTFSQIISELQEDSVWKNTIFGRTGVLSPEDKDKLLGGEPPVYLELDPDQQYMDDRPINNLFDRFEDVDTDFGKKLAILDQIIQLMRLVPGVHSSVIGDTDVEKRVSGVALHTAQQATLISQESARQHLNAASRNLGELVWNMIQEYWIFPQTIKLDNKTVIEINTRVPVTPETSQLVDLLRKQQQQGQTPRNPQTGQVLVPSGLHVDAPDGEEEIVIPLDDTEVVQAILSGRGGLDASNAEYSFNYLPLVDAEIRMDVQGDADSRDESLRQRITWASTVPEGKISWETLMEAVFVDDPYHSPDLERNRLYGERIGSIIVQSGELGQEQQQQLTQAVEQFILQLQQGSAGNQEPGQQPAPNQSNPNQGAQ